ncbi:MAG: FtsX-like permease family protein, partial [Clostridia bacterium]
LLFLLIIYVINIVKNKAKNIVILRSLGCSNKEYFKVFGLILVFLNILFLGFAICFGCIFLANLQNYLINSELMNVGFYNLFAIDVFAVLLSIALLLITSVVALMVVIKKINSKNIRMSFQQGKD